MFKLELIYLQHTALYLCLQENNALSLVISYC